MLIPTYRQTFRPLIIADTVNIYAELTAPKTCDIRLLQALIGVDFSICLISKELLSKTGRI